MSLLPDKQKLIYISGFLTIFPGLIQVSIVESSQATVKLLVNQRQTRVWPEIMGINLNPGAGPKAITDPKNITAVKKIGIKSVRFPNGCVADRYNWKAVDGSKQISVDQFLTFCEAIGAESYYTLNLQGGTHNKKGTSLEGADLKEVIKYQHIAPNPCGWTNYHFGTLAEAVELVKKYTIERALAGKRPILCYEMGNENWGQATTDWPPEVYAATIAEYARALREVVSDAQAKYTELADLELYIIAVGYPLMGNNQDPKQAANHEINVRWTREINALYQAGLIDAVQDHFYPYSNLGFDYLIWSHFNLQNILFARRGVSNPLLGGYRNEDIAFDMPIEITEWNAKCWGELKKAVSGTQNLEFEEQTKGWDTDRSAINGKVKLQTAKEAGRHKAGLRISANKSVSGTSTIFQRFDWKPTKSNRVFVAAWIRTDQPRKVALSIKTVNKNGELGSVLEETGRRHAWRSGHWHKIIAGGKVPEGVKQLAVCFDLNGPGIQADIDGVELFFWNNEHGVNPAAVATPAQQLFLVDAFRLMIEHGIRRSHLHHLFGSYPCGIMLHNGQIKDSYKVFELFANCLGTHTVKTTVKCDTFDYDCQADKWSTPFNALAPDVKNVPLLSALATRDKDYVYVLMINRSTDQYVKINLQLQDGQAVDPVSVRSLVCEDFDVPGVKLIHKEVLFSEVQALELTPHSAHMFKLKLDNNIR